MKKRVCALITCTATMALLAGCGSSSGASGGSSQMSDIVDKAVEDIQEVVTDPDEKVLIDRPNPEIEVTAEEFQVSTRSAVVRPLRRSVLPFHSVTDADASGISRNPAMEKSADLSPGFSAPEKAQQ